MVAGLDHCYSSPTHTQHTHAYTEKLPSAYIIWCVNKVPANSPTSGDFKWFQLVPDRAFQTCEKFPFKSTQTQPIQTHTDSYCVSEKTSSVVAKQVLEKAQAGSSACCQTPVLPSVCSTARSCVCVWLVTRHTSVRWVSEHFFWETESYMRQPEQTGDHCCISEWQPFGTTVSSKSRAREMYNFLCKKLLVRWWQKFINLYVS